jgi:RimJ/RimL family protein N-acetyltransferase
MTALRLRSDVSVGPILPEYAATMLSWMCDPEVSENIGLRAAPSLESTALWIENALVDDSIHVSAILAGGQHVGNVVIDRIDNYLREGRLSAYIGGERGRGFGLTGLYLAIEGAFRGLDLYKIYLTVQARNYRALNVYCRLGFTLEGIHRDEFILRGERIAALYMGLLRQDFSRLEVEWV